MKYILKDDSTNTILASFRKLEDAVRSYIARQDANTKERREGKTTHFLCVSILHADGSRADSEKINKIYDGIIRARLYANLVF